MQDVIGFDRIPGVVAIAKRDGANFTNGDGQDQGNVGDESGKTDGAGRGSLRPGIGAMTVPQSPGQGVAGLQLRAHGFFFARVVSIFAA